MIIFVIIYQFHYLLRAFNSFYSSCEEKKDPSLKGKPHAVIMTPQDNTNKTTKGAVTTCSYEAKQLGIKSAMPLYKALELCPNLTLHAVDKKFYEKISNEVMGILEKYADILNRQVLMRLIKIVPIK